MNVSDGSIHYRKRDYDNTVSNASFSDARHSGARRTQL